MLIWLVVAVFPTLPSGSLIPTPSPLVDLQGALLVGPSLPLGWCLTRG
jgi:hypothetical protein